MNGHLKLPKNFRKILKCPSSSSFALGGVAERSQLIQSYLSLTSFHNINSLGLFLFFRGTSHLQQHISLKYPTTAILDCDSFQMFRAGEYDTNVHTSSSKTSRYLCKEYVNRKVYVTASSLS